MKKLLVIDDDYQDYARLMVKYAPTWQVFAGKTAESLAAVATQCDIWLGSPNHIASLLKLKIPPAKWIQSTFAGITPLLATNLPQNYLLTRAVGVFSQQMTEYVLSYMLAHERHLFAKFTAQQKKHWLIKHTGTLQNKRVLIVGAGSIGIAVANQLKPFGVKLTGIATTNNSIQSFERMGTLADLTTFVAEADYIINLLPDTPYTHNIYCSKVFAQMKQTAVFINAGRGTAVVDDDLIAALQNNRPCLAVLDVFRTEPLPINHPFWLIPNLLITEHTAAKSSPELIFDLFTHNLQKYEQHQTLIGQVDFKRGY